MSGFWSLLWFAVTLSEQSSREIAYHCFQRSVFPWPVIPDGHRGVRFWRFEGRSSMFGIVWSSVRYQVQKESGQGDAVIYAQ